MLSPKKTRLTGWSPLFLSLKFSKPMRQLLEETVLVSLMLKMTRLVSLQSLKHCLEHIY